MTGTIKSDIDYRVQYSKYNLIRTDQKELFNTQMDFVVYKNNKALILDAKWKVLDVNDEKLGISQSDLYQLFAYSEILRTKENKTVSVALLYPQTAKFYTVQEWSYFNGIKIYIVPVNVLDKNDNILLLNIIERF